MIPVRITHAVNLRIDIVNLKPEHIPELVRLQKVNFPTLTERELLDKAKYLNHLELFPEGQFVALAYRNGETIPIGSTSTFRTDFDFDHSQHTFLDAVANGWLTNHDPKGEWLYGADMNVHPKYRGMRIGRRLYEARQALARKLNLRGEIAGGLIPGYHDHAETMSVAQYVLHVHQARLHDPTLSMQLRNGFQVKGILYNHIADPRSHNCATLIVRENPYYHPKQPEG
ncbi:MAG TPA: GNAT family N-acetyltransferase [Phototrophicaceae bacterium]|nr:GNAT family N-acetyltransferase [Phototrophicaceae bacterium]